MPLLVSVQVRLTLLAGSMVELPMLALSLGTALAVRLPALVTPENAVVTGLKLFGPPTSKVLLVDPVGMFFCKLPFTQPVLCPAPVKVPDAGTIRRLLPV